MIIPTLNSYLTLAARFSRQAAFLALASVISLPVLADEDEVADVFAEIDTKSAQEVDQNSHPTNAESEIPEVENSAAGPSVEAVDESPYEVIELSRGETFNLFSMGKKVWSDTGLPVRVYVLPNKHKLHKRFAKQKIGSFPHVLSAVWDRYVYSGSGQRPNQVKDERAMQEAISNVEGAVGYLPDPDDPSKVILVRNK